jgi:UTP--glucose-1-phosphate uridylyltransferase
VSELARQGAPVWAVELQGIRYDTGDKLGYVKAFIDAALRREDLAPLLRAHLKESGWRAPGER